MQQPWFPVAPHTLEEAGLELGLVEQLVLKSLYDLNGATGSALAQRLGLPAQPLRDLLTDLRQRKLVVHRNTATMTLRAADLVALAERCGHAPLVVPLPEPEPGAD